MGDPRRTRTRLTNRLGVLANANVRRYFVGYVASNLGTAMSSVALAFAVLDSGGDADDLGVIFAAGILVQVVLMLGGGVLADRLGRRRVMLSADVLRTGCQGVLAGLLFAGHPPIWAFVVLVAARSAGDALFQPAFNGLIVDIAPAEERVDANALFGTSQSAAQVAGPALAGILVAVVNPATVIGLDAASYGISALTLAVLVVPRPSRGTPTSLISDLSEGWQSFRAATWLWAISLQFTLSNLLMWGPFLLLGPVLARADLSGARSWGLIMAAYALGSVLGGMAALGRQPRRPLLTATLGTFASAAPVALLAASASTLEIAAGALIGGIGSAIFNIFYAATIQREIPSDMQARVSAFDIVGAYSAGPIAFAGSGPLAHLIGAHVLLGAGAASGLFLSSAMLFVPSIRQMRGQLTSPSSPAAP